jgi:hypothetical protein
VARAQQSESGLSRITLRIGGWSQNLLCFELLHRSSRMS